MYELSFFLLIISIIIFFIFNNKDKKNIKKAVKEKDWDKAKICFYLSHSFWGMTLPIKNDFSLYIKLLFETNDSLLSENIKLYINQYNPVYFKKSCLYFFLYCILTEDFSSYNILYKEYGENASEYKIIEALHYYVNEDYENAKILLFDIVEFFDDTLNFILHYYKYLTYKKLDEVENSTKEKAIAESYPTVYNYLIKEQK